MLQRVVCFKYKPETSEEQINAHLEGFRKLPEIVPGIASYRGGLCFPNVNGALPEYSSMHYLTFKTLEDMAAYFHHLDHQKFGKFGGEISEKILVLNSEISAEVRA
ncbi:MAG: Dabb family protein [Negativicutes bacterium]|nr:Dabb family protein [Negativicutes bacterium]